LTDAARIPPGPRVPEFGTRPKQPAVHRERSNGNGHRRSVSSERSEILALIARLTAVKLARAERARARGERGVAPPTEPPSAPGSTLHPPNSASGIRVMLLALESRLRRIEEQLDKRRRSSLPVPIPNPPLQAHTFSGLIQGQMLSDMLQLVSSNTMSGVFTVENETGRFVLHFSEGRIVHAEGLDLMGEEAFFAAFGFESGAYTFRETEDLSEKKTIESGTQYLILEALRRIDESRGD
jgi:hypothetical protein